MGYAIIIIVSILIILGVFFYYRNIYGQEIEDFKGQLESEYIRKKKKDLDYQFLQRTADIKQQEAILARLKQDQLKAEEEGKAHVDRYVETYKGKAMQFVRFQVKKAQEKELAEAKARTKETLDEYAEQCRMAGEELQNLMSEVADYQAKQDAINQEILRRRELEEKKDFYRVCLPESAHADIEILTQAREKLKNSEIVDKIIYESYVSKPVLEMIKRVLANTTCSGIYKITCLTTGEVYIGKSTDVKNRWQQHCKTAFNCGTIASSLLHIKMRQYGIENFAFELLEKVPKDQLTEREKFYINFYQTKEVGLNERNG